MTAEEETPPLYLKIDGKNVPDVPDETEEKPNEHESEKRVYHPPTLPANLGKTVLKNWVKGFYFGYGIEVLPHVVSLVFGRDRAKQTWAVFGKKLLTTLFNGDAAPFGVFMGAFSASFPAFKVALARLLNRPEGNPLISTIAGGLAGSAILFDCTPRGKDRRMTLALYMFVRAMEFGLRAAVRKGHLPNIEHMDTILFQLSCTEIMYSWLLTPESLPKAYVSWITRMAQMDERLLVLLRSFRNGSLWYGQHSDLLTEFAKSYGYDPRDADPFYGFIDCHVVHPENPNSCTGNFARRWRNGFLAAILIYLPVHSLPALFWRFGALKSRPLALLSDVVLSTGRSASFLATFIAVIWGMICLTRNTLKTDSVLGPFLGSAACGFSLLIEKKSRRLELALYCVPRALYSAYLKQVNAGRAPIVPHFDVFLFCMSSALLMYCYDYEPQSVKGSIRSFMRWFVGPRNEIEAAEKKKSA